MSVRVRFAPSPTGLLHVGNVRTALFNWLLARKLAGTFILRIEDTDADRSETRYEAQLLDDLRWLGLDWDEGIEAGGDCGPYRQTERISLYQEACSALLGGGHAYYCFCSPEQLEADRAAQQAADQPQRYVGRCRSLEAAGSAARVKRGEAATVRLRVPAGTIEFHDLVFGPIRVDSSTIGDFILLRSDGSAQYNLACVVDDSAMQISHVIRGEGHISNTPRQLLLYQALGVAPPAYAHLSTILGPDGAKLSKRHGATAITEFRELGYLPEALINYLSLLGWSPSVDGREIMSVSEIVEDFDLARVNVSPATFDFEKLNWFNRTYLKQLEPSRLGDLAEPHIRKALKRADLLPPEVVEWRNQLTAVLVPYVNRLADFEHAVADLCDFDPGRSLASEEVREVLAEPGAIEVIRAFQAAVAKTDEEITFERYREIVLGVKEETGQKGKQLFRPIRVAVTGRASGPELDRLLPVFEKGSRLNLPVRIRGVRERVAAVWEVLERQGDPARS